jgi:hypothetical protein
VLLHNECYTSGSFQSAWLAHPNTAWTLVKQQGAPTHLARLNIFKSYKWFKCSLCIERQSFEENTSHFCEYIHLFTTPTFLYYFVYFSLLQVPPACTVTVLNNSAVSKGNVFQVIQQCKWIENVPVTILDINHRVGLYLKRSPPSGEKQLSWIEIKMKMDLPSDNKSTET